MRTTSTTEVRSAHGKSADGSIPPHDGSHPVRLVLLLELFALLTEYGYRRPSAARSTAQSLRLLNELTVTFEAGR